uniref:Heat shock protein 70 n=1 Tax=Panagrolaimus sp. ES5 TaxID=591445 RepID=A0AC34FY44_9BILA
MAGVSDQLDFVPFLSFGVTIHIGENEIMSFNSFQRLPVIQSVKLKADVNIKEAILRRKGAKDDDKNTEIIKLPNFSKYFLRFKADVNSVYSVEFIDASDLDNNVSPLQNFGPKLKKRRLELDRIDDNSSQSSSIMQSGCQTSYIFPKKFITNNVNINAVGIDLGTTRCCVAVNRKSGIETVAIENESSRLMPSYVSFEEKNVICGNVVVQRLRNYAESTVFDCKRIIGRSFSKIVINDYWPFEVLESQNNAVLKLKINSMEVRKTPEEIAADLLKNLKQKVEQFQGKCLSEVVITIPATFTKSQEDATHLAAVLAGWDTVVFLPEPIAAAFAYFIDRPLSNNSTVLLFDLGGGTLDVCIFEIKDNQIQIISKSGDASLGGRDFDNLLIKHFEYKLKNEHNVLVTKGKIYTLMLKCQEIKHALSTVHNSSLDVDDFDPLKNFSIDIARETFEELAQNVLKQIHISIMEALNNLNYQPNQISKILLVGGGSRMPMVKKLLQNIFPESEQCCEEHPDEVVAIGAAYYAYGIYERNL